MSEGSGLGPTSADDALPKLEARMENLTFDNYPVWSSRLRSILEVRGLWGIVTGDEEADTERDSLAKATIFRWVDPQTPLLDVGTTLSAKKAWESLEGWYKRVCRARRFSYRSEICNLKKLETECIIEYVIRARDLSYRLKAAGLPVPEEELAIHVLQGLPEEYATVVLELQTSDEAHTVWTVMHKLRDVEATTKSSQEADNEATAEQAEDQGSPFRGNQRRAKRPRHDYICWECGDMGHNEQNACLPGTETMAGIDLPISPASTCHAAVRF